MSILIKGMKMPKAGAYLASIDIEEDYAMICIPQLGHFVLAEVPEPHGRLIDAEVVNSALKKRLLAVDTAPTIIEAEGEE